MTVLYLVGAPASGKTTVLRAVMHRLGVGVSPHATRLHRSLIGHRLTRDGLLLGVVRPGRSGTDGLSMGVMPDALAWAAGHGPDRYKLIIGEGARLGTPRFLTALTSTHHVIVGHLTVSDTVQAARMAHRHSTQNPSWAAGAATAAAHTADALTETAAVIRLDTNQATPRELADELVVVLRSLHSVLR
jgi:hypothetical protein